MELLRDKIKRDTYMVSKLSGMINRDELKENHPQQRKSGQWDNNTRDNFIVTVIKNEDFDPIKICEQLTKEGVILWLIDGLQRSTIIANYKSGKFALGRNIDPCVIEYQETVKGENGNITYQNVTYDLRGKAYKDLPEKLKEDFDNCPVNVVKHLDCTDEEVGRHIVRYNSGRPMVTAQKISAYMYNTAKYVKELSGHAFFNDCANYSETADKNGTVDKVVSEAIMGLNFFNVWNKDAKKIGKYLNDNATEEMFHNFGVYLDRLLEVITPETGKLFSSKNALIWFMLFDRFTKKGVADDKFQSFLEKYDEIKLVKIRVTHEYELVKGSGEYTNNLSFVELDGCKSTKDKGVIEDKLLILETLLDNFIHNSSEEQDNDDIVSFVVDVLDIDADTITDDMDTYNEDLDLLLKTHVWNGSELLDDENRPSLLAMVIYSYVNDVKIDDWFAEYIKRDKYYSDQKVNFIHMKNDLDRYCKEHKLSA